MPRRYRVAVIGHTGRGNYGHGLDVVWLRVPNVTIVAVADPDDRGRAAAQRRLRAERSYADYREMLRRERPQIVSVAPRWLDAHRNMVVACAEHGAHVLLEKPMCRTLEEADAMIDACTRRHVKLAIAHQTRYSPVVARIQELIRDGRIGDILELRGRGKEDRRVGGEDLMVLGTHIMDLMRVFAGDPRWCFATVEVCNGRQVRPITAADVRNGAEGIGPLAGNSISAMYSFAKGIKGYFASQCASRPARQNRFGLMILGSRGVIQLTTGSVPPAYYLADPSWFPGRSRITWQPITSNGLGRPETLTDRSLVAGNEWIARDLIDAIENDREPKGSGRDGRAALEMILATYESQRTGGPVRLPMENRRHPLDLLRASR